MIDKIVASAADAVADVPDGATVMIGGFGTAGLPNELIDALHRAGREGPRHRQQQRRQRRHGPGRAAGRRPRAQDHLQLPAPGRLVALRQALPRRQDRARAGAAGQPRRAHPRRRRRHRRLLHAHGLRHRTRQGQGNARDRRPLDGAGKPDPRRLRADQGRTRRPLGQPHLPHDGAQLRPDHGDGGQGHRGHRARGGRARRARPRGRGDAGAVRAARGEDRARRHQRPAASRPRPEDSR